MVYAVCSVFVFINLPNITLKWKPFLFPLIPNYVFRKHRKSKRAIWLDRSH